MSDLAAQPRDRPARDEQLLAAQVRDALVHLHDLTRLETHPLAHAVDLQLPTSQATRPSVGRALHKRLVEAIEAVRPGRDAPAESHAWRSYHLLRLRYLEALEASRVQRELSISKSEYHRDHNRAILALVSLLGGQQVASSPGSALGVGASRAPEQAMAGQGSASLASGVPDGAEGPRSNLPIQLTSFVGREREIAEVRRLLGTTRLLTLTGTGGCGKTRLALQVARQLLADCEGYSDGVWLVQLAATREPALVPLVVATTLDVRQRADEPILTMLTRFLQPRRLLLVLDNCEQLLDACARLAEPLLQSCPQLRILATSREMLGVPGEVAWRVPSLAVPEPNGSDLERIAQSESVRLFAERARLVQPDFAVTEDNARTVALICLRLDGIPLAIELAATRTRGLGLEQIVARLDDRFRLLTGGSRTALPRQQTLRATLDWSHDLLTAPEQVLLRRLAVFAGGWTLEAAEVVCVGDAAEVRVRSWEALDLLMRLVDRSLVVVEDRDGESRYRLLETIRQYARERLAESGEEDSVRDRHRDLYVAFAEACQSKHFGPEAGRTLDRIDAEFANLRLAHERCLETDGELALRLVCDTWYYWRRRGHFAEARRWFEEALARTTGRSAARGNALVCCAGFIADAGGDVEQTQRMAREGVEICREAGDARLLSEVLRFAAVQCGIADVGGRKALCEEGLALARRAGFQAGAAWLLWVLGDVAIELGEADRARQLYEESLEISRRLGDLSCIAFGLMGLAELAGIEGDYQRARGHREESVACLRRVGDRAGVAVALYRLGDVLEDLGDLDAARAALTESLMLFDRYGCHPSLMALARLILACVAIRQGALDEAVALLTESLLTKAVGASDEVWLWGFGVLAFRRGKKGRATNLLAAAAAHGVLRQLRPDGRATFDRLVACCRVSLGEEAFARVWSEGQAMTLEQAVEYALGEPQDDEAQGG